MPKKFDARAYAKMSAKELFVVFQAAVSRQDYRECTRIGASVPRYEIRGIDPETQRLILVADHLAGLVLFDLQNALGAYRGTMFAANVLCIIQGVIPFGIGMDEEALAQLGKGGPDNRDDPDRRLSDLEILHLRDVQNEAAQVVDAILSAIRTVCEEEVGLSAEQLIGASAPYGLDELQFASSISDLDPSRKVVKTYLDRYRMIWRGTEELH